MGDSPAELERGLRPRLLPRRITARYGGAPWIVPVFALLVLLTLVRSVLHIVLPDGGAESIATIALSGYSEAARGAVIHIFSLWGLSQLLLGAIYLIVLLRYRSLVPLMLLTMLVEYSARLLLGQLKPVETVGTAPGAIGNIVLPPVLVLIFVLSLIPRRTNHA